MKRSAFFIIVAIAFAAAAASADYYWVYKGYWGSFGTGESNFIYPSGIAAAPEPEGYVYVADTDNHRIQYFLETGSIGSFVGKWGSQGRGDGQFNYPVGVAVGRSTEYVYVADRSNHRIQYFTEAGQFLGKWGKWGDLNREFKNPWDVDVAPNGNVYVADATNNRIQYFTSSGSFLGKWGEWGSGDGQFIEPRGVAVTPNGRVYVADLGNNRIQYFTWKGSFLGKWGARGSGDGQFESPKGVAVWPFGKFVFVADAGNDRVQYFDASGSFVGSFNGDYLSNPGDVAISQNGSSELKLRVLAFVADTYNNSVRFYGLSTEPAVEPTSLGRVKALFR
jgi:DNA-binding beta-propeller fold protein YncE